MLTPLNTDPALRCRCPPMPGAPPKSPAGPTRSYKVRRTYSVRRRRLSAADLASSPVLAIPAQRLVLVGLFGIKRLCPRSTTQKCPGARPEQGSGSVVDVNAVKAVDRVVVKYLAPSVIAFRMRWSIIENDGDGLWRGDIACCFSIPAFKYHHVKCA
jgi:hypothetical protein